MDLLPPLFPHRSRMLPRLGTSNVRLSSPEAKMELIEG